MYSHCEWMYTRVVDGYVCNSFQRGVQEIVDFTYGQDQDIVKSDGRIICHCKRCALLKKQLRMDVEIFLYKKVFVEGYKF